MSRQSHDVPTASFLMNPAPIDQPYLLVLVSVPFHIAQDGRRYIDKLWAKDLQQHTRYLKNLTLASSAIHASDVGSLVSMDDDPALSQIRCVELPAASSTLQAIGQLPKTLAILRREASRAKIIHSSIAGWPIPEAWLLFLSTHRRHFNVLVVESAFWRLPPNGHFGWRRRTRAWVSERVNRWFINHADVSIFTQEQYRLSLLTKRQERGHVIEASWIDADDILDEAALKADIARLGSPDRPLRLVFAGRLAAEKGISFIVPIVLQLIGSGISLQLDIFGEGPEKMAIEAMVKAACAERSVIFRTSLPYGPLFFAAIREFDALIVPTLSDEQPRIVFDAYSQGVPVIASNTPGLTQCVTHLTTGLIFRSGDQYAAAEAMTLAAKNRSMLLSMRSNCVVRARESTHREMHNRRWRILSKSLGYWNPSDAAQKEA